MRSVFLSAGHSNTDPGALRDSLTAERLREVLRYDPDTGVFRWRQRMSSRAPTGAVAGCSRPSARYVLIRIDGVVHAAHRLAWLYVHGRWPSNGMDHRNGATTDNRIENLREANHAENAQNQGVRRDNPSGHVGVAWDTKTRKWHSRIRHNGKDIHLGYHAHIEEAVAERVAAKARIHTFQPAQRQEAAA